MAGRVAGLLLAAGGGRRFGGPKALAVHAGELLVERGARLLTEGGTNPVVVVVGAAAGEVRARARLGAAEVVDNPRWREGMASSLVAGLRALDGRAAAVVVALADQPAVGAEAVRRLVEAWGQGAPAAVATYGGAPRNPVLLDASLWQDVADQAKGDAGARSWLRSHPELVRLVPCDGTGRPCDVDTPEDLEALAPRTTGHARGTLGCS